MSRCNSEAINSFFSDAFDYVYALYPNCNTFFCGDFNRFSPITLQNNFDLSNCVTTPTRGIAMLDYVLLSPYLVEMYQIAVSAPISTSDHNSIVCTPLHSINIPRSYYKRKVFDMRNSFVTDFVDAVTHIDWLRLCSDNFDVNTKCIIFNETMLECVNATIPSFEIDMSDKDPPWLTPYIKHLINERWSAYRRGDFSRYLHLRDKVKIQIASAKTRWASSSHSNSKSLWNKVHGLLGDRRKSDPLARLINSFASNIDAADAINSVLCKVFQRESFDYQSNITAVSIINPWHTDITVEKVYWALVNYPSHKAYGADSIPTFLYQCVAHIICIPLCNIFNSTIIERTFPAVWKHSHVIPIPKCASPSINDIRPISLLPVTSKLLERFVVDSLILFFLDHYGKNQFGFRPKSSTCCNLITLVEFITKSLDRSDVNGVQIVSYDFSRAFDKLCHSIIIERLRNINAPEDFIYWLCSYLHDRSQSVIIGNSISASSRVYSGVPQGSILGPFLFSLVIATYNPVSDHALAVKFADDLTICFPLLKNSDNAYINTEHAAVNKWANYNKLYLNIDKCKSMVITHSKYTNVSSVSLDDVQDVDHIKLLGVTLSYNCKWNKHCQNIVSTASQKLHILKVLKKHTSRSELIKIYFASVRSSLEYCAPLFGTLPVLLSDELEHIQYRAHRIICGQQSQHCNCDNFTLLSIRRQDQALKLFRSAMKDSSHVLAPIMPKLSVLSNRCIQPIATTSRRLASFIPSTAILYNSNF